MSCIDRRFLISCKYYILFFPISQKFFSLSRKYYILFFPFPLSDLLFCGFIFWVSRFSDIMSVRYPIFSDKIFSKGRILFLHILRGDLESCISDRGWDDEIFSLDFMRRIRLDWILEQFDEIVIRDLFFHFRSKSIRSGLVPSENLILSPLVILPFEFFCLSLLECPFLRVLWFFYFGRFVYEWNFWICEIVFFSLLEEYLESFLSREKLCECPFVAPPGPRRMKDGGIIWDRFFYIILGKWFEDLLDLFFYRWSQFFMLDNFLIIPKREDILFFYFYFFFGISFFIYRRDFRRRIFRPRKLRILIVYRWRIFRRR